MRIHWSGHAAPRSPDAPCQDAWAVRERDQRLVAALADGMGSAREGGAAARHAVEMLGDYCLARPRAWSPRRALAEFSAQINRHLHAESLARFGQPELACTLTAIVIEGGRLYGCNLGDSPAFHWRRGRLQRLSCEHALSQPGLGHVLTRAVGLEPEIDPHFFELELAEGDLVLLCSDGVAAALPPERLAELLSRQAPARAFVSSAARAAEHNLELADDRSAIVLELLDRGRDPEARQRLEVARHLRAGDEFDGYQLVRRLADNERVWLAQSPAGARVVLKFPPLEAAENEIVRNAFVREAWNAARLASADLVRAWAPEGATLRYYAMDYVEAPTLRARLRQGRLTVEEARALAECLLRVGQFLLQHDLAHGDIKPENILVLRERDGPRFRLLDLGSAAELFSITSRAGTASYLAPERFQGAPLSERTEIFAIGVTLHEALTGAFPYGEIERFQTPRFGAPPRRPAQLNSAIPPWLDSILLRAIEPEAERRYQHFSEMAYDLAHPARVTPHHRKGTPLVERDPVLFWKAVCLGLVALNLWLLSRWAAQ